MFNTTDNDPPLLSCNGLGIIRGCLRALNRDYGTVHRFFISATRSPSTKLASSSHIVGAIYCRPTQQPSVANPWNAPFLQARGCNRWSHSSSGDAAKIGALLETCPGSREAGYDYHNNTRPIRSLPATVKLWGSEPKPQPFPAVTGNEVCLSMESSIGYKYP